MTRSRLLACLAMGVVLAGHDVRAQTTEDAGVPAADVDEKAWSFSAAVFTYVVPDQRDYAQPTITADRDWLHLEARYNYEDLQTGSAWVGWNFGCGETVTLELTLMVGGVFGDTYGVAPGYELSLGWRQLSLDSESEYVFDTGNASDSFFYTWSELAWSPVDWFRVGLVSQRTRAYSTDLDVQRGFLVGIAYEMVDLTAYVFNPDESQPTVVVGLGLSF